MLIKSDCLTCMKYFVSIPKEKKPFVIHIQIVSKKLITLVISKLLCYVTYLYSFHYYITVCVCMGGIYVCIIYFFKFKFLI